MSEKRDAICPNQNCDFELELTLAQSNSLTLTSWNLSDPDDAEPRTDKDYIKDGVLFGSIHNILKDGIPLPKYCPHCGEALVYACPACGLRITDRGSNFCMGCRAHLKQPAWAQS